VPREALAVAIETMVFCGLGNAYVPGGGGGTPRETSAEASLLTSDPRRLERNRHILQLEPRLAVGAPTLAWLRAAFAAMRVLERDSFPATIRVPVLMIAASNDRIVSNRAIERLAAYLKVGEQIVIAGGRHELLQERNTVRDQFWAAFDAFVPGSSPILIRQGAPALAAASEDRRRQ
jgi:lysophospholipase